MYIEADRGRKLIYYIADTHFGDERVMRLAQRPFTSVNQMNNYLCGKWNAKVGGDDTVYILGDFAFDDVAAQKIFPLLNGHKHLILGNHDKLNVESLNMFESINQIVTVFDEGRSVCLCHYPLLSYENSVYGGYHIFGHIHNNQSDLAFNIVKNIPRIYNGGVDVNGFCPVTLDELIRSKA